ncbi:formin-like protein 20 isoform X14 [Pomacea canaliculata]|uniref:formin-like protein 20 isoform X14 n=1 Tax=Pomacea canaliculata TaxID=400727 RepID=UPI000D7324F4|nr:formin-like protein 20 isoform X14 [Pomacea canaliculata]
MVFADLVHCCWTVEYDDKSMMKTRKKMYKFCAVPERPGRRPLPPPADDFAAPSLPPRPGGKNIIKIAPPPQETRNSDEFDSENSSEPGEIYDDCEEQQPPQPILPQRPLGRPQHIAPPEEFYDDCNEGKQEQEVYDDFEEEKQEKQLPKRPATQLPPIPLPPEESYDDLENIGPVVVQPMKPTHRTLPPPPPSSIQRDLDHDDFPPPPSPISGRRQAIPQPQPPPPPPPPIPSFLSSESQDIYEVSPDIDDDIPSTPPLPPKADVKPVKLPPKVPNMPAGGFLVDQSQINALKNKLKKVSGPDTPKTTSRDPKEYSDNHSISELHQKFQLKAKPSDTPDKHALRVQMNSPQDLNMASLSSSASSSLTNMSGSSSFLQHDLEYPQLPPRHSNLTSPLSMTNPDKTSSSAETSSPPVHKNNALMPLPPLPSVTKMPNAVQPSVSKQEYTDDNPEEIYDDASSSDWLDRFDWYHGPIDRKEGEARVKSIGKDGTYLVRISTKNAKFPYTLVVLLKGHVSNLHIRLRNDKKYALGDEKDDELAFNDIPEMISHHKKHHVLLMGNIKSQVTLQQTPPKK